MVEFARRYSLYARLLDEQRHGRLDDYYLNGVSIALILGVEQ